MNPIPSLALLALALSLSACGKKPEPSPAAPAAPAPAVSVDAASAPAAPPPNTPPPNPGDAPPVEVDFSKMSNEDKYMLEMADSITTYIQDHLRNKGRMPKDAQDILTLKIMDRLEVPPAYVMVIDQKTGKVSFKKKR